MSIAILLLASVPAAATPPAIPVCRPAQLRVSTDGRDGDFNGMSHSGTELSIRNIGSDCLLPALPTVALRDARGRPLAAVRRPPIGMHPGPVMIRLRLGGGHRAACELRWVAGPVYPTNHVVRSAAVAVRIGSGVIVAPLRATLYGANAKSVTFDQTPFRVMEGMPAG